MERGKMRWLLLGVLCLALWPVAAPAQEELWKNYNEQAQVAYKQGRYAEAERLAKLALKEAARFGGEDPRFATSLNNLALLYADQGRYAEAEPLYQRALAIREKVLGPDDPSVAATLENYAALLRRTNREAEAEKLEACAHPIRAKALETVLVNDEGLTCHLTNGEVERITWKELVEVSVVTTDRGPFEEDVFFVLVGSDGSGCAIPQGSAENTDLVKRLLRLPGFDHEKFIEAMGSTENARFVCWQRDSTKKATKP